MSFPTPATSVGASANHQDDIVTRIERVIQCRAGSGIYQLQVELVGSHVVISGTAKSYHAKQLATHAAMDEVTGVTFENTIDVV